ncbi:MAG: hypothetical protein EBZ67_12415 [Chitinophagia bacterium]|nr:hypothetical protein [Chitinophagia bacterium]
MKKLLRFDSVQMTFYSSQRVDEAFIELGVESYRNHFQQPILTGGRLYILLAGTGKLYESDQHPVGDSLYFRRVDSTFLDGYNICAFAFAHQGIVHNLGGYGYWHWNGQLRAFNHKMREWEIVPLNREVAVSIGGPESFIWHDQRNGRIYAMRAIMGNEAVKGDPIRLDEEVRMLNLSNGEWKTMGDQTEYATYRLEERKPVAASDSGLLVIHHNTLEYWLPSENRILVLSDKGPLAEVSSRLNGRFTWMRGGMLYYGNPTAGSMDSLPLHTGMFRDVGYRIWRSPAPWMAELLLLAISAVFVWGLGVLAGTYHQREFVAESNPAQAGSATGVSTVGRTTWETATGPSPALFDEVERSLLSLLLRNGTEERRRTSTQEVNRVLGVGGKSPDMQKRKRSDVIRSINRKYRQVVPEGGREPIVKERNGLDARMTEYSIHPEEMARVAVLVSGS